MKMRMKHEGVMWMCSYEFGELSNVKTAKKKFYLVT